MPGAAREPGSDGGEFWRRTMWMRFMLLNYTLRNGSNGKFCCILSVTLLKSHPKHVDSQAAHLMFIARVSFPGGPATNPHAVPTSDAWTRKPGLSPLPVTSWFSLLLGSPKDRGKYLCSLGTPPRSGCADFLPVACVLTSRWRPDGGAGGSTCSGETGACQPRAFCCYSGLSPPRLTPPLLDSPGQPPGQHH